MSSCFSANSRIPRNRVSREAWWGMSSRSRTCSCTCRKPRLALAIGKRSPRRTKANWATAEDVAVVTARVDSAYLTGGIGGSSAGTSGPLVTVGASRVHRYSLSTLHSFARKKSTSDDFLLLDRSKSVENYVPLPSSVRKWLRKSRSGFLISCSDRKIFV